MAIDKKVLGVRTVSASIFVIVLLSAIYFHFLIFSILFFGVSLLALNEFYNLIEKTGVVAHRKSGIIFGALVFISIYNQEIPLSGSLGLNFLLNYLPFLMPFMLAVQFLFTKSNEPLKVFSFNVLGIFYCIVPFALLVLIPISAEAENLQGAVNSYHYFKIMGIIFLIWANDTFAYIGGSLIGRNKMYERASPGKTWEGTIVGVICCILVGFVLNYNGTFGSNFVWPIIALFIGVFGTLGDLVESLMKRIAGIKDSGNIMPGHGGILDRFDSLMFVSPFVFIIVRLADFLTC